jgi:hypothetical protein
MASFNHPVIFTTMKTILEITPTEKRSYEMPTAIYNCIQLALNTRRCKSVKSAVESLPEKWRSLVMVSTSPHEPAIRGKSAEILIDDILQSQDPPSDQTHAGRFFDEASRLHESPQLIKEFSHTNPISSPNSEI